MKKCRRCLIEKPEDDFYRQKAHTGKYYPSPNCILCSREIAKSKKKERYHDPATRVHVLSTIRARVGTDEYKEKVNQTLRDKYQNDFEFRKNILNKRKLNLLNPITRNQLQIRRSRYYQNHKHEIIQRSLEKTRSDPRRRLRGYMRGRISEALAKFGKSKDNVPSLKYLSYTWDDLYRHLEKNFEDWMTFLNYGAYDDNRLTWQVDHIIPQIMFPYDSMDSELFKMCWDLKNLRPISSERNIKEGNRQHLFGTHDSIYSIFEEVRSHKIHFSGSHQKLFDDLSRIHAVHEKCPMSFVGLSYLDEIFAARFNSKSVHNDSLNESLKDDWKLFGAILSLVKRGRPTTPHDVIKSLQYGIRMPGHFFPGASVSIIKKYANNGVVFDPFLGWGGRTLGAMCSPIQKYTGCDLQRDVVDSCARVHDEFSCLGSRVETEFMNTDCLEYLKSSNEKFDLIFSSPPFLDTEDYGVESDSMKKDWIDTFCFPLLEIMSDRLFDHGHLAFHLKDIKGSPTFSVYHSAAKAAGFNLIAQHPYGRNWSQSVYVYRKT
jgi:hypothetical protein